MTIYSVTNALGYVVQLSMPILIAALIAAALAGVIRVVTQIDDSVISFVSKLTGVGLAMYLFAGMYSSELVEFTQRIWGGSDFYH